MEIDAPSSIANIFVREWMHLAQTIVPASSVLQKYERGGWEI